jgi:hypothetical protein
MVASSRYFVVSNVVLIHSFPLICLQAAIDRRARTYQSRSRQLGQRAIRSLTGEGPWIECHNPPFFRQFLGKITRNKKRRRSGGLVYVQSVGCAGQTENSCFANPSVPAREQRREGPDL